MALHRNDRGAGKDLEVSAFFDGQSNDLGVEREAPLDFCGIHLIQPGCKEACRTDGIFRGRLKSGSGDECRLTIVHELTLAVGYGEGEAIAVLTSTSLNVPPRAVRETVGIRCLRFRLARVAANPLQDRLPREQVRPSSLQVTNLPRSRKVLQLLRRQLQVLRGLVDCVHVIEFHDRSVLRVPGRTRRPG
jgi:hypothetical protein